MKFKRLTTKKSGTVVLVKKEIDLNMFSPIIAKVLTEALEQLAMFETKAEEDELMEVPFPLGARATVNMDGKYLPIEIIGYQIMAKEMKVILHGKNDEEIRMDIKEALKRISIKKNGSVSDS